MNIFIDGVDYTKEADLIKSKVSELTKINQTEFSFSADFLDVKDKSKQLLAYKLTFDDGTFPHIITYDYDSDSFHVELRQLNEQNTITIAYSTNIKAFTKNSERLFFA